MATVFYIFGFLTAIFALIPATASIYCFQCTSHNDTLCPEFMTSEDADVVPYISCDHVYDAQFCVKTTGVTGDSEGIHCFVCDTATDDNFGCTDELFSARLSDCTNVFDAQYCVKTVGIYGGSLGTQRYCSSKDMGNYCEYIRRVGDQHEYRSCVYTCSSNGCNPAERIFSSKTILTAAMTFSLVAVRFLR